MHFGRLFFCLSLFPALLIPGFSYGSAYQTSTHLGVVLSEQSTTGFQNALGSATIFDVTRRFDEYEVGLRTLGQGGGSSVSFYRMSAGPLITRLIQENWLIHFSVSFFKEAASQGRELYYRSEGTSLLLGWERRIPLMRGVEFSYGGYFERYLGDLQYDPITSVARLPTTVNEGVVKGLEVSLRVDL